VCWGEWWNGKEVNAEVAQQQSVGDKPLEAQRVTNCCGIKLATSANQRRPRVYKALKVLPNAVDYPRFWCVFCVDLFFVLLHHPPTTSNHQLPSLPLPLFVTRLQFIMAHNSGIPGMLLDLRTSCGLACVASCTYCSLIHLIVTAELEESFGNARTNGGIRFLRIEIVDGWYS
jgi:hypothetical protein